MKLLSAFVVGVWAFGCTVAWAGEWERYLPPVDIGADGLKYHRTIIHVHNVNSHDACDRKPYRGGKPDTRCIDIFRRDLCKAHIDVAFLTEHRGTMSEIAFSDVMAPQEFENVIWEAGEPVGLRLFCPDAHVVTIYPGAENRLMPIGLKRHPEPVLGLNLEQTYNSDSVEAAKSFRDAGAIVGVNHLEDRSNSIEYLKNLRPDFVEAYNLHANLMGILKGGFFKIVKFLFKIAPFLFDPLLEPDLYYLTFQSEDNVSLQRWGQLNHAFEAEGKVIPGIAGTDAHANYLKNKLVDGERMDSYRRAFRWFSNYVRTPLNPTREEMMNAIVRGEMASVFEVFGRPDSLETYVSKKDGSTQLEVRIPGAIGGAPGARIYARWYRATEKGWEMVAQGGNQGSLIYTAKGPGIFRAEIRIIPKHLKSYIPLMGFLVKDSPWVYFSPVLVR